MRSGDKPACESDDRDDKDLDEVGAFGIVAPKHVGGLLFLTRHARPDIGQAVGAIARRLTKWRKREDKKLERIYVYLRLTRNYGLIGFIFPGDKLWFVCFVDADFAGCKDTRRSTTCFAIFMRGECGSSFLIAFYSGIQKAVSLSTCEAEYRALCTLGKELMGYIVLASHADPENNWGAKIYGDNAAAEIVCKKGSSRSLRYMRKTAGIQFAWAQEHLARLLGHVPSPANTADIGTKPLPTDDFSRHRAGLGVLRIPTTPEEAQALYGEFLIGRSDERLLSKVGS